MAVHKWPRELWILVNGMLRPAISSAKSLPSFVPAMTDITLRKEGAFLRSGRRLSVRRTRE